MSKCIRCGGSFLTRRKVKLKDADICGKCYKELGFDNFLTSDLYSYDDIKDGRDAYRIKKAKEEIKQAAISSISVIMNDGRKDLVCTEEERQIFNIIRSIFEANGLDPDQLELIRMSDNYVSVKLDPWDVARIKYTNRAKWILFPSAETEKHQIESPEDVKNFTEAITKTINLIDKYDQGKLHRL